MKKLTQLTYSLLIVSAFITSNVTLGRGSESPRFHYEMSQNLKKIDKQKQDKAKKPVIRKDEGKHSGPQMMHNPKNHTHSNCAHS